MWHRLSTTYVYHMKKHTQHVATGWKITGTVIQHNRIALCLMASRLGHAIKV